MQRIVVNVWYNGNAHEAGEFYAGVLPDTTATVSARYPTHGLPDFQWFAVTDGGQEQDFAFSCGVSLEVSCHAQAEIDRVWNALSAVPEAEQCGWLADEFGVSWQIVPSSMAELMQRPHAYERLMEMKKIIIADL